MNPGRWMMFSAAQLANLNGYGGMPQYAPGTAFYSVFSMFSSSVQVTSHRALVRPGKHLQHAALPGKHEFGDQQSHGRHRHDTITGNDLGNVIDGGDTISGGGTNTLYGEAGNDTLISDGGVNDQLIGGTGDDTYIIKSASAVIVEQPGEGTDIALIYVNDYTIGANVEVADLQQGVTFVTGNNTGMTINGIDGTAATIIGGSGK